jgi:hypothetical protein
VPEGTCPCDVVLPIGLCTPACMLCPVHMLGAAVASFVLSGVFSCCTQVCVCVLCCVQAACLLRVCVGLVLPDMVHVQRHGDFLWPPFCGRFCVL